MRYLIEYYGGKVKTQKNQIKDFYFIQIKDDKELFELLQRRNNEKIEDPKFTVSEIGEMVLDFS